MKEKLQKAQFAIRITLISFISVVLGFALYQWNALSLTGNVMPMPFGVGLGVVMSGSMEPELSVDDVIVVVEKKEYAVDEIVVFQQRNLLVVHKIIAIDEEWVITQGTANNTPDEPMKITEIKGVVLFHIDGLDEVITWLKSPFATFLILGVASSLLISLTQSKIKTKRKKTSDWKKFARKLRR